jgi:hypothetical protein
MKSYVTYILIFFFLTYSSFAKTLNQKKNELKKIYQAGGISKVEYEKSLDFLEKSEEEKTKKQTFTFTKKDPLTSVKQKFSLLNKKDEDLEKVTLKKIKELGEPVKFDDSYYTKGMTKRFVGCNNSFKCKGGKAGKELSKAFNKDMSYGQKAPGKLIKAMAMFEVLYSSKLWEARKSIKRYEENNYKDDLIDSEIKKNDEKKIRALFGMNKGRNSMREALSMNSETSSKEAIKKFWLLGEFLDLGTSVKNKKLPNDLKERQKLIEAYKIQISNLKKKIKDENDVKNNEKPVL